MSTLTITSYPPNTAAQIQAFLSTIHPGAGGKHISYTVQTFDGPLSRTQHIGTIEAHSFDRITTLLQQFPKATVKNYIHSFNPYKKKKSKPICQENLNMIDTIALSFKAEEMGYEDKFVNRLFDYCVKNDIPMPNAYSLTGDGGVDIYYSFDKELAPTLLHGIQTLASLITIKLNPFLDELKADNIYYTTVTDMHKYHAKVRLPGTMNPKTGVMCQFYKTNADPYTYNELFDIIHPGRIGNGSPVKEIDYSQLMTHADKVTPRDDSWGIMLDTRIDGLLNLASVYDLSSHSDEAIYLMAQFCKGKYFSKKKTYKIVTKLTKLIRKPISKEKIDKAINADFRWFRTPTVAKKLGLSIDDERFINAFHVKGKYRKPKELKLNSRQSAKAELYIAVAKELVYCNQFAWLIAMRTGYTIDQVKKCCREIRKDITLIDRWSKTTLNDVDFILEFFGRNKTASAPKKATADEDTAASVEVASAANTATPTEKTSEGKEEEKCAEKCRKNPPRLAQAYTVMHSATVNKAVHFDERSLRRQQILAESGILPDKRKISIINKFSYTPCTMEVKPLIEAKPRTPFLLPPVLIEKMLTDAETIDQSKPLTAVPEIYESLYYYTADQRFIYKEAKKQYNRALRYHNTDDAQRYADICNACVKQMHYAVAQYNTDMELIRLTQPRFRAFDPVRLCIDYGNSKPAKPRLTKEQRLAQERWRRQAAWRSERNTCERIVNNIVHAPARVVEYAREVLSAPYRFAF